MGLGLVMVVLLIEELFDTIWNAVVAKRRKAEEEADLQRIERLIASVKAMGQAAAVEERGGPIDVIGTGESISHEVSESR
jgi:hypothetical protein